MARFFVGQRVRLVRTVNFPELVGRTYTIVALGVRAWAKGLGHYEGCALDGETPFGNRIVALPGYIEPILPEGHQPARWEDCAWQPDHLRERVA